VEFRKKDNRPKLKLIQGGLQCEMSFKSVRIVASPEYLPPFEVDAIAAEEDTFLIMSADTKIRETDEHIVRLMTKLIETEPEPVGSVLVRGKNPIKFLAIVHDVNQEPTWNEEWIISALEGIFREAERRNLPSIALPLLGTLHGSLEKERFVVLLKTTLERASINHLKRLWLIVPDGTSRDIIEMLKSAQNHNPS